MKLALSILCENPARKTGLTTLFHEFVARALTLFPDLAWIVFAGPRQPWPVEDARVEIVRRYPANDDLPRRLFADHFLVPPDARARGADALLTVGFLPLRHCLPVIMHVFSLQHLSRSNRVGRLRAVYRALAVRRGLARAEGIVTNSRFAAEQILADTPACRDRLTVSYEGLQHAQFQPAPAPGEADRLRAAFGLAPGYVLWVSNFYVYKQADLLLDAYARLDPALRAAHPLVMVGGGWEGGMDAARARVTALGIAENVRFLNWVDDADLGPLYRHARAFVLASREETFGRCVVEAMACGTPCVVNDIPIMHEVTGGHALIVDFRQAPAAASALGALLTDHALHARLRAAGIPWTAQFSFERLARERIEAIRAALGRGRQIRVDILPALRPLILPFLPMLERLKLALRAVVLRVARLIGSPVVDVRTGQTLGRALLVAFRGRVYVIGLDASVVPVFAPQKRLTYWKQELGFTVHPPPDFSHEPGA